ncbi:hypothetical protein [Altererythrobacter sp. Root672]|uniref:hypothetical protein n=1 Tax=Altererythrobacter sp. Root672 TaxID=1736584 RepID=UPI0006F9408F|nr:hypothetical protein [Altererythrobacter sp. Root672]KRA81623.1 hypothetical protein ASD76_13960 [Altererythrobacter sp. Root672]
MSALPPNDHRKLVGILSRLASDAEGERAAAGPLASQVIARHGVSWTDLLSRPATPDNEKAQRRARYPGRSGAPAPAELLRDHQREAWLLLVSGFEWTDWERGFLSDLRALSFTISVKQRTKLRQCRCKVDAWREREAA